MSSLNEFRRVLTDWRSLGPYLFAGSTALPLTDLVLKFGPPWPVGAPVLFCVFAGVMNVAAFHIVHAWPFESIDRSIRRSLVFLGTFVTLYLVAWGTFTVQVPAHNGRIPIGWSVQPDVKRAIDALAGSGVPNLNGPIDLLNDRIEQGQPPLDAPLEIWNRSTVHVIRFLLLGLWSGLVASFAWTSIAFTLYHRRKQTTPGSRKDRFKKTSTGTIAVVLLCSTVATFGQTAADDVQEIDARLDFDRRARQELDQLDASFMRWQFPSRLRWTSNSGNHSSPLDGIVINKTATQSLNRYLAPDDWWMPVTFTLAHEKAHLVQAKKYVNASERVPAVVLEAQADVMAASYVFLRIMRLQVDMTPDNHIAIRSTAPERDPATFAIARQAEVFDLMRLGYKLGAQGSATEYPEDWERGAAVLQGLFAASGMLRLSLAQTDEAGFRREFGFTATEDFADWSLRKAYEIVGLPARTASAVVTPRFTLANSSDPIGSVIRRCVENASTGFAAMRGQQSGSDADDMFYVPTIRLPDFHRAVIQVDRMNPLDATVQYSKEQEFPADIELALYQGLKSRLMRLLRNGWKASTERVSDSTMSQRWTSQSGDIEIAIVHRSKARGKEISLRISVEHVVP